MKTEETWTEEFTVDSESLNTTIRDLIREGKARRIHVKNADGKTVFKVPLWLGIAAIFNNPRILALGALTSTKNSFTLVVEKVGESPES